MAIQSLCFLLGHAWKVGQSRWMFAGANEIAANVLKCRQRFGGNRDQAQPHLHGAAHFEGDDLNVAEFDGERVGGNAGQVAQQLVDADQACSDAAELGDTAGVLFELEI